MKQNSTYTYILNLNNFILLLQMLMPSLVVVSAAKCYMRIQYYSQNL